MSSTLAPPAPLSERRAMTRNVIDANERYFDAVADHYDSDPAQRYGCYHPNSRARYRAFIERNRDVIRQGLTVNLGCGTGNMMDVEASCGLTSMGIDISWAMLQRARRVSARLVRGDVHHLPLPDGCVSLASGFLLLHHIYDHDLLFQELYRVLLPGGLLFCDYDPSFYASTLAKDHWLMSLVWRVRRRISYRIMQVGHDQGIDVETARLADYYSEIVPGLKGEDIGAALERAGFTSVRPIVHSDSASLATPRKGRLAHQGFEAALWLLGERAYEKRAKILAVVAQKPGPQPSLALA